MAIHPVTDELIAYLNDLVALDRDFMDALVKSRHPCNQALIEHESVQVGAQDGVAVAGLVGILNGFAGVHETGPRAGWGAIAAEFDAEGKLRGFFRLNSDG